MRFAGPCCFWQSHRVTESQLFQPLNDGKCTQKEKSEATIKSNQYNTIKHKPMPFFSYCASSMDMLVPRGHASVTFSESHVVFWYVLNVPDSKAAERNSRRKKKIFFYCIFYLLLKTHVLRERCWTFAQYVWNVLPTQIEISREVFFLYRDNWYVF